MSDEAGRRRWLRPLGLLAIAFILAIGQPMVTMVVAFALLTFVAPRAGTGVMLLAAAIFAVVFGGGPASGLWYLERGWAISVAGGFAAVTLAWPRHPFLLRALAAVGVGGVWSGALLVALNGWPAMEQLVMARIQLGIGATLGLIGSMGEAELDQSLVQAMARTGEVQGILFPALVALSTVASLGVAWWLHVRLATGSDRGLGPLRDFRFPDQLIWILIAGLMLVMVAEWSGGWGRVGSNLVAFMGALYVLRGAGVLLALLGGISYLGGFLLLAGLVLAGPLLLAGALIVGVGDSWFDLRARHGSGGGSGTA